MMGKNRTILWSTTICGIILLGQITIWEMFPEMTFVNGSLNIAYRIVGYFTFSFCILGLLLLFKANSIVTVPLGILLFLFFFVNSCSEIYPVDTTTEAVDIGVLGTYENGNKLIARRYKNVKTHRIIEDTVLVKDYFIFRQLIEVRSGQATTNH
jgi:hypothetical protein